MVNPMTDREKATELEHDFGTQELSIQAQKLRNLRELHALKVANHCLKNDVEQIKRASNKPKEK